MAQDIAGLERKLRQVDQSISELIAKRAEALIPIIHRPGWTTIAEGQLVTAMVDHLQSQIDGVGRAYDALLAAAEKVGSSG